MSSTTTPSAGHTVTLPGSAFPATRREFLAELRASDRAFRAIQARRFELLAQVDVLWSAASGEGPVVPGLEQLVPAGSDGTPLVAEFASLELAAAMHLRPEAIDMELSLATDCLHRLPYAWAAVMAGDLPVWLAKKLASMSGDLDFNGARALDADLRDVYGRMPAARLEAMARGLLLKHLPAEQAEERRAAERERRFVEFGDPGDHLLGSVQAVLDKPDQRDLEAQVSRLASILRRAGVQDTEDGIRARALGMLANPALALQMLQASLLDPEFELQEVFGPEPDLLTFPELVEVSACELKGRLGHTCGTITVDPEKLLPTAKIVVHLTDTTAKTGEGVARIEGIGPALGDWLKDLLGDRKISVRPVLDTAGVCPVDSYEVPDRMRETVEHRNPFEVFPWSTKRASRCDLDHTVPFDHDGTPGQTRPDNLGPLGRRVHRAKTHGKWRLEQVAPGCYLWRSPEGFVYLVTPSLSLELHDPTRTGRPESPPVVRLRWQDLTSSA
ncbi:hypothetical protein [Luteococcus sanguinis]|uniref:DUF222 domain-containing protein n=1 Tax=Luteococcus sanguinis TaxID=174038 RepID=A0ABW1X6S9_9ACTN